MDHIITSIRAASLDRNWYAALALALALPDMCVKASTLGRTSGAKYAQWFDAYVGSRYSSLSGADCYALRCAYLHEARDTIEEQRARQALNAFHFLASSGQIHHQLFEQVLQLDVGIFCEDICQGAEAWKKANGVTNLPSNTLIITEADPAVFAQDISAIESRLRDGIGAYELKTVKDSTETYIYDQAPARLQEGLKGFLLRCGLTYMESLTDDAYIGFDDLGNFMLKGFTRVKAPKALRDDLNAHFGVNSKKVDSFLELPQEEMDVRTMQELKTLFEMTRTHSMKPLKPGEKALLGWDIRMAVPVEFSYKNLGILFYEP